MSSGTYSPSLNVVYEDLERRAQEQALAEVTSEGSGEFERLNRLAVQLALMSNVRGATRALAPSVRGVVSSTLTLPTATAITSHTLPMATLSKALTSPISNVINDAVLRQLKVLSKPLMSTRTEVSQSELPQVGYLGWGEAIDTAEYDARLAAITPGLANNESEEHVPPPPRGKIRAIPLD